MDQIGQHQSTLKHVVDAAVIPSGIVAGFANYMDAINSAMTFLVLLTSLIWGVYRIIDMRNSQRRAKR